MAVVTPKEARQELRGIILARPDLVWTQSSNSNKFVRTGREVAGQAAPADTYTQQDMARSFVGTNYWIRTYNHETQKVKTIMYNPVTTGPQWKVLSAKATLTAAGHPRTIRSTETEEYFNDIGFATLYFDHL